MFIDDSTYKRNGKTYRRILLRNSYRVDGRVRHDTLANLSSATNDEIQAIKLALKHKGDLSRINKLSDISTEQGLCVGAVWLLFQLSKRLGLTKALGSSRQAKLVLWLVMAAAIEQGSRLSAVRLAQRHQVCDIVGLDGFNEEDLYQAMDWLEQKQSRIEDILFQYRYGDKKPQLYLYDVTSSYFEGQQNELAHYGYNRDKKSGKKQIVIGLMTDDEGRPITIEVFEGNTSDPKTVENQVIKMAQRFDVEEVTFIGDRGMVKSKQMNGLNQAGFHYITAITKPQIASLIRKGIIQEALFDQDIAEIQEESIRYILRCNPVRKQEIEANRQEKFNSLVDYVASQNSYLGAHPKAQVEIAIKKAVAKSQQLKLNQWVTIIDHNRCLSVEIDHKKKQACAQLDGCYVIKTDLSPDQLDTEKVHASYKNLAVVETAFRTMKTVLLEMRGIYVRKANRTRAHVLIIMLSYLLVHHLRDVWRELEVTVEEGIAELASLCSVKMTAPGCLNYQTIPTPRLLGQALLDKANITLPDVLPCRNAKVVTKKKLVSERK